MFKTKQADSLLDEIKNLCPDENYVKALPAPNLFDDRIIVTGGNKSIEFYLYSDSEMNTINRNILSVFPGRELDLAGYFYTVDEEFNFTVKDGLFSAMTFAKNNPPSPAKCMISYFMFYNAFMESCITGGMYRRVEHPYTLQSLIESLK